jgi:lysozyme
MPITCLEDQLRRDESSKRSVYKDSLGFWTIGVGICVDGTKGCGLTDEEIAFLLENRIKLNAASLSESLPWTDALDEVRRGALLNMVFQLGMHGLSEFEDMLTKLKAKDFSGAAAAGLNSLWASKQSPERAQRLMKQIETGVWQ